MSNVTTVQVKILTKDICVNCPQGAEEALAAAAAYLEKKMRETRKMVRVSDGESIATLAALNLAHELLSLKNEQQYYQHAIENLSYKIDQALEKAL
jgi:cell division protein ZapA